LQAVALGLGSVSVGGFQDADVVKALDLPEGQTPFYVIPVGKPAT
jgi:nitroreductase